MPKGIRSSINIADLLAHIQSMGIASRAEIGGGNADALLRRGLIVEVWKGSYALTEAGKRNVAKRQGA